MNGIDFNQLTEKVARENWRGKFPTITGKLSLASPTLANDYLIAQAVTINPIKITIPGPLTIIDSLADDFYYDNEQLGKDLAIAIRQEILNLVEAGCEWIQIDEPVFARKPKQALKFGIDLLNEIVADLPANITTIVHICCGYPQYLDQKGYPKASPNSYLVLASALDKSNIKAISIEDAHFRNPPKLFREFKHKKVILGVVDVSVSKVETVSEILEHLEDVLQYIPADRLLVAPDSGLGLLPTRIAKEKILNLVTAVKNIMAKESNTT